MQKGEEVTVRGPFGWFKIQDSKSPIVLFASGVGITPIRALFNQIATDSSRPVLLVCVSNDYHLLKSELEKIAAENAQMTIQCLKNRTEASSALAALSKQYGNQAYYYISGSGKVISSVKKTLKSEQISGKRIITDPFFGY